MQQGHNSELTEVERKALFLHHLDPIYRAHLKRKEANEELKRLKKVAKADGIMTMHVNYAIKCRDAEDDNALASGLLGTLEVARWLNVPLGTQFEMFDGESDRSEIANDGYSAGWLGTECRAPEELAAKEQDEWLQAWHAGQKERQAAWKQALLKKKAAEEEDGATDQGDSGGGDDA